MTVCTGILSRKRRANGRIAVAALVSAMAAGAVRSAPPRIEDLLAPADYAKYLAATGPITFDTPATAAQYKGCIYLVGANPGAACRPTTPPPLNFLLGDAYDSAGRLLVQNMGSINPSAPGGFDSFTRVFNYTILDTQVTHTTMVGGGITANVRIAGTTALLGSATALTLNDAVAGAQGAANLSGLRGRVLPGVVQTSGVIQTSMVTGTSTVLDSQSSTPTTTLTFGPDQVTLPASGRCDASFTQCESAFAYTLTSGETYFYTRTRLTLNTTTTVNQTVTSTGLATIDIPIAAPGYAHAGVQVAGFDQSDRFLGRIAVPGAAGIAPLGIAGWSMFLEGAGTHGTIGRQGDAMAAHGSFGGMRGGIAYAVKPKLLVGIAAEWGHLGWSTSDVYYAEHARGSGYKVGAFAALDAGPVKLGVAGFVGRQHVRTRDSSLAGAGISRSRFTASLWGVGASAALPLEMGGLTVTPRVGVDVLGWSSPGHRETGGLAPLSVAHASRSQVRPSAGLDIAHGFDLGGVTKLTIGATSRVFAITGDRNGRVLARDLATPDGFAIVAPGQGKWGGDLGAFATLEIAKGATLSASWAHRFSGNGSHSDSGQAGLRIAF